MVSQLILLHARYFVMDCRGNKRREVVVALFGNVYLGECLVSQRSSLIAALTSVSSQLRNLNHHPCVVIAFYLPASPGALELQVFYVSLYAQMWNDVSWRKCWGLVAKWEMKKIIKNQSGSSVTSRQQQQLFPFLVWSTFVCTFILSCRVTRWPLMLFVKWINQSNGSITRRKQSTVSWKPKKFRHFVSPLFHWSDCSRLHSQL